MRIGFLSTRLAGTDGVSLETRKWAEVARRLGHEVYYCAGLLDDDLPNPTLIPELHFRDPEAMALAASRLRDLGGGVVLINDGRVDWEAPLPLAGQMAPGPFEDALSVARELKKHLQDAGYPFSDPLYSLLFLTADFLPGPRLTWSGVLDARKSRIIHEAESIDG